MNAEDQNQDFDQLQRLLKLKRYELPPPRYFNEFSGQVTARIRAGESSSSDRVQRAVSQSPWLRQIWQAIESRPAIAGVFATGICGLLLAGGFLAGNPPLQPGMVAEGAQPKPAVQPEDNSLFASNPNVISYASTNPSVTPSSLFGTPTLQTLPVNYSPNSPNFH